MFSHLLIELATTYYHVLSGTISYPFVVNLLSTAFLKARNPHIYWVSLLILLSVGTTFFELSIEVHRGVPEAIDHISLNP